MFSSYLQLFLFISRIGYSLKRKISQFDFYKDRDSQIRAIEKSFETAKQPVCQMPVFGFLLFFLF
jgi:hypothetical protein